MKNLLCASLALLFIHSSTAQIIEQETTPSELSTLVPASGGWGFTVAPNPAKDNIYITANKVQNVECPNINEEKDLEFIAKLYVFTLFFTFKER